MNEVLEESGACKVICAFYASAEHGSEYRAGMEFIKFAAAQGFTLAVIADLELNSPCHIIEDLAPGIHVVRIRSLIRRQTNLYRYTDLLAQVIWHRDVARWIRTHRKEVDTIWVQNGASPWLPLSPYLGASKTLVWGPVGGGGEVPPEMMKLLPVKARLRERVRSIVEWYTIRGKVALIRSRQSSRIVIIARTMDARASLLQAGGEIPVIPEILEPLKAAHISRRKSSRPRFVWVGQDVPRKNLPLAIEIFDFIRKDRFREATLDVFGCERTTGNSVDGVTFHGWVAKVPWAEYRDNGVLLLTSYREGLPSVVLEAVRNGLLCIASDVGAVASLNAPTIHVLPRSEYPNFSYATLHQASARVCRHLTEEVSHIPSVSNAIRLREYLEKNWEV
jgi:glycosyltransferase involved in cell wall biosynthesis